MFLFSSTSEHDGQPKQTERVTSFLRLSYTRRELFSKEKFECELDISITRKTTEKSTEINWLACLNVIIDKQLVADKVSLKNQISILFGNSWPTVILETFFAWFFIFHSAFLCATKQTHK